MQDLLGRIAALDPDASLGIRVIGCFDELIVGGVNTRGLLAAAAALGGCVAGCSWNTPSRRELRVDPLGRAVDDGVEAVRTTHPVDASGEVWLERDGAPRANDAIILERLALAVRLRRAGTAAGGEVLRPLAVLLDEHEPLESRRDAAAKVGLFDGGSYRVLVAPLSAIWTRRVPGPSDVIGTPLGLVHVTIADARATDAAASLLGVGVAVSVADLPRSYATAFTAARLTRPGHEPVVVADDYGGLLDLLTESAQSGSHDADRVATLIGACPWAEETIAALGQSSTVRQAARVAGVHHSTLQSRVDALTSELGFDPLEGFGRTRLAIGFLLWRLRASRVFELPADTSGAATSAPSGR